MSKSLTIIGRGESWKECPFNTELWGTATCLLTEGLKDRDYAKVFAFDDEDDAVREAKKRNIPLVSKYSYATEPFPLIEIVKFFKSSYFMPTVSYMLAYAIFLGYGQISLYGIDQGPNWDYQAGKSHILFWLGVAMGKGIDVRVGQNSMRWAYRSGKDKLPVAFLLKAHERVGSHI